MTLFVCGLVLVTVLLVALCSGAETGFYSLSRLRLDAEVRHGHRAARWLRSLLDNDTRFLITLLVGLNLVLELSTHLLEEALTEAGLAVWARELVVTALLTPLVFVFGELLPKDAFRRRPYLLLRLSAPFLEALRLACFPIVWPLERASRFLERSLGVGDQDFARALGREEVVAVLEEGSKTGAIAEAARDLARNILVLRHTPVAEVMTAWERVKWLDLDLLEAERRAALAAAEFTRLPALRRSPQGGRSVVGYLHQLEALADPGDPAALLRPLPEVAPDLSVERTLARLRLSGQRVALVGTPEHPEGLVTVMDLVAAISRGARARPRRRPPDPLAATAGRS